MSFTTQIPVKSYIKAYLENNYGSPCDLTMLRRFGWQLSKTDTIRFNQRCEAFIKFYSRQFIMANNALGIPVSECIREFQHLYNFSEDSFPMKQSKKTLIDMEARLKSNSFGIIVNNSKIYSWAICQLLGQSINH